MTFSLFLDSLEALSHVYSSFSVISNAFWRSRASQITFGSFKWSIFETSTDDWTQTTGNRVFQPDLSTQIDQLLLGNLRNPFGAPMPCTAGSSRSEHVGTPKSAGSGIVNLLLGT